MKSFWKKLSSNAAYDKNLLNNCDRVAKRMGNTGSTHSSKRKGQKRESGDSVGDRPRKTKKFVNGSESRTSGKEIIKCRATNPFIIFFLRLRSKKPKEHVTVIARAAGKLWTQMTPEQRKKYVQLANAEKKRREEQRRKRKLRRRKGR
ncbi:uncharacterized protein LOC112213179 [Bombus impatiens]|uniref:Uncharacterized protein LOC112213179 n=1 Tax=Bombus impatiens TaxID=132113 RepID=A0A6P6FFH1_BOMIM|nr:uncharacterized protein LOC112213179 [Bombus impatiens]